MTPKEKAEDLIDKIEYSNVDADNTLPLCPILSKKLALICVEEIIRSRGLDTSYKCEDGNFHDFDTYWESVKQEIQKL